MSAVALLSATAIVGSALASPSAAATTKPFTDRVSVTTGGFHGGHGGSTLGDRPIQRDSLSKDGRYALIESAAPLTGKTHHTLNVQVFLRDRKLGTTTLVSVGHRGQLANQGSFDPVMSDDARYVAFQSYATNLVPDDTNGKSDIFVRDLKARTTTRVSTSTNGAQLTIPGPSTYGAGSPAISPEGRYVGFVSGASGLVSGDSTATEAYLKDTVTGELEMVSRGQHGLAESVLPASSLGISRHARRVAFHSGSSTVVPGDTNSDPDIFIRDRTAGTTAMVPVGEDGSGQPALSADGTRIAFVARNTPALVAGAPAAIDVVYVHNLVNGTTAAVSRSSTGAWGNAHSTAPAISADGRYISFTSSASNLVAGDTNGQADVFRHDAVTGQTTRVSVRRNGGQNALSSRRSAISGDGQHVLFETHGGNLTPVGTGGWGQVFVRSLNGAYPALLAKVGKLPKKMTWKRKHPKAKVATSGIAAKQSLQVIWKSGKKKITTTVTVKSKKLVLKAPRARGRYNVTVRYAGHQLRKGRVTIR
ncbi:TolB family protein [Nocardioides daejeonensis]|uniref:TolB family protein n=1 Tax=Nocardioides daejeonensis TaxID=1046556 RepID=UPI000D7475A2|nr:PD40 domain-containing protein [Nocardioides daejeonensis]